MKRFLVRLTKFFLLQTVIATVVFGSAHLHFRKGYLAAFGDKLDLLESEGPPRILFVGGSSVAFGIDSEQFESFQRQPVNLGLHASLGLDLCATLVERHVRPGDLVVLMPEHSHLLVKMKPDPQLQRSLLRQCPRAARYLDHPWPGLKTVLDQRAIPELACWAQAGIQRLPSNIRDDALTALGITSGPRKRLYSRASFDCSSGDMIAHHSMPPTGQPDKRPLSVSNRGKLVESITRLNRCIATCRSKGASVVYAYPPMPAPQYAASREAMNEITAAIESHLNCPIITHPDTAAFPVADFFDRSGHLSVVGKRKHTAVVIAGLHRHETDIARSSNAATILR
jgi:hypothetical protein